MYEAQQRFAAKEAQIAKLRWPDRELEEASPSFFAKPLESLEGQVKIWQEQVAATAASRKKAQAAYEASKQKIQNMVAKTKRLVSTVREYLPRASGLSVNLETTGTKLLDQLANLQTAGTQASEEADKEFEEKIAQIANLVTVSSFRPVNPKIEETLQSLEAQVKTWQKQIAAAEAELVAAKEVMRQKARGAFEANEQRIQTNLAKAKRLEGTVREQLPTASSLSPSLSEAGSTLLKDLASLQAKGAQASSEAHQIFEEEITQINDLSWGDSSQIKVTVSTFIPTVYPDQLVEALKSLEGQVQTWQEQIAAAAAKEARDKQRALASWSEQQQKILSASEQLPFTVMHLLPTTNQLSSSLVAAGNSLLKQLASFQAEGQTFSRLAAWGYRLHGTLPTAPYKWLKAFASLEAQVKTWQEEVKQAKAKAAVEKRKKALVCWKEQQPKFLATGAQLVSTLKEQLPTASQLSSSLGIAGRDLLEQFTRFQAEGEKYGPAYETAYIDPLLLDPAGSLPAAPYNWLEKFASLEAQVQAWQEQVAKASLAQEKEVIEHLPSKAKVLAGTVSELLPTASSLSPSLSEASSALLKDLASLQAKGVKESDTVRRHQHYLRLASHIPAQSRWHSSLPQAFESLEAQVKAWQEQVAKASLAQEKAASRKIEEERKQLTAQLLILRLARRKLQAALGLTNQEGQQACGIDPASSGDEGLDSR